MSNRVPKHITKHFGGTSAFRKRARKLAREAKKIVEELGRGCVYFPCGSNPVRRIEVELEELIRAISVKEWGR